VIRLDSKFSKGYYRLGQAFFKLGKKNEAIEALENGLRIDKEFNSSKLSDSIEELLYEVKTSSSRPASRGPGLGGFDLASMMADPTFQSMAQSMLSNPAMMSGLMESLKGAGGDAGGMPDLSSLMSSPALAELREDPEMAAVMSDVQTNGPAALTKYMSDPKIMSKISSLMSKQ
jgi:small glutamine-rich tetratricopeptide repeat-containing protein alpha